MALRQRKCLRITAGLIAAPEDPDDQLPDSSWCDAEVVECLGGCSYTTKRCEHDYAPGRPDSSRVPSSRIGGSGGTTRSPSGDRGANRR